MRIALQLGRRAYGEDIAFVDEGDAMLIRADFQRILHGEDAGHAGTRAPGRGVEGRIASGETLTPLGISTVADANPPSAAVRVRNARMSGVRYSTEFDGMTVPGWNLWRTPPASFQSEMSIA